MKHETELQSDGWKLGELLPALRIYRVCETSVKQNGLSLYHVPVDILDANICDLACSQNGRAIQFVPSEFLNSRIVSNAVKQNGTAIEFFSRDEFKQYKSLSLYFDAVRSNGSALRWVPAEFRTKKLKEAALLNDGTALRFINHIERDYDQCMLAVSTNGTALRWAPEKLVNLEMCEIAINNNGMALQFAINTMRGLISKTLKYTAVKKNGYAIKFIPVEELNQEICQIGIESEPFCLPYIPAKFRTQEIIQTAIRLKPATESFLNIDPEIAPTNDFIDSYTKQLINN